ncbi:MAG: hypothetical protein N2653_05215 [Burkholderiales bacterium]|nr:hypothetical protein [Burkholderiales bacterium]
MRRETRCAALLWALAAGGAAAAEPGVEAQELLGHFGGRAAVMNLYAVPQPDGSARVTGDYVLLPALQQRYLEGERSKQLGVTHLREGSTPILYGRPPLATLQGTWSGGVFRGTRYGPAGQVREHFELQARFPSMDRYEASVRCEVVEGRYRASLAYVAESGRLRGFEWRSRVAPAEHPCHLADLEQQPQEGGLRLAAGDCTVLFRDLGPFVRVTAAGCAAHCGSQGYLEPMLVDRRGNCFLLRPQR